MKRNKKFLDKIQKAVNEAVNLHLMEQFELEQIPNYIVCYWDIMSNLMKNENATRLSRRSTK